MRGGVQPGNWALLSEDREAVLAALLRGETDGILPAASLFMDRFARFLIKLGIPSLLDGWPDHRKRRSIAPFFFSNVLLHKSLFRLDSLSAIGGFLFSSPDVMRALGFNMRQITEGFYSSGEQRPFNEESLSDFFASCEFPDFLSNQKQVLSRLVDAQPEILEDGTLIMDCKDIRIPAGNRGRPQTHLEACVVSSRSHGELLPILWSFIPANAQADISQGKVIVEEILPILGGKVKRLIVDRGFISGAWVTDLKERGIDTIIGLKTDMVLYQDMVALSKLAETIWLDVEPPKYHSRQIPVRQICYLSDLDLWEECRVPLAGIVIRDSYCDRVEYQAVVTTDLLAEPETIHSWSRSRWDIEETFMEESRYGKLDGIGPCRVGTAAAIVHFSLLAYTLLRLFARREGAQKKSKRPMLPSGGVEMVCYWKCYYAIILPSLFVELVGRCPPKIRRRITEKLKVFESSLQ